jgi:hypothetical protein
MRANDYDVLQAGAESFERIDCVVVKEEECAVEGEGAWCRQRKRHVHAAACKGF